MLVPLLGKEIEVARLAPGAGDIGLVGHASRLSLPPIVFLHEALGSVSHWRDFPQRVADATGSEAIVYSRYGHGRSARRDEPFAGSYLEEEALTWLPALLDALEIERPLLFGHSDGASIALVASGGTGRDFAGLVVLAPHVMVEHVALAGIERAKIAYAETDFSMRLAKHHDDPDGVFRRWHETWLRPERRAWSIEEYLLAIECPVLAIQGNEDEYATMEQVDRIGRLARRVERLKLANCGHAPHRDRADAVIAATRSFVGRMARGRA